MARIKKTDEDEEKKVVRTMVHLRDFNTTLNVWGIESIDKTTRFLEHPKARWQFGIVINAGMDVSIRYPKTNVEAWYEKEEYRDKRYEELLIELEEFGFKIIEI